jgi:GntR family transcriptional repressor for pyruvate dehydrogenase complex
MTVDALVDHRPDNWTAGLHSLTRVTAADAVLNDLRLAIERGEVAVGLRLPSETSLAHSYAVSRSVVREALRSCASLGLTKTLTGKGTFVVSDRVVEDHFAVDSFVAPDRIPDELIAGEFSRRDLMDSRPCIEIPAARLAAERRTAGQLTTMEDIVTVMLRTEDPSTWVTLNRRFHAAVAQASDTRVFQNVLSQVRDAGSVRGVAVSAHRKAASDFEHSQVLRAIRAGSTRGAEVAMAEHLAAVDPASGVC